MNLASAPPFQVSPLRVMLFRDIFLRVAITLGLLLPLVLLKLELELLFLLALVLLLSELLLLLSSLRWLATSVCGFPRTGGSREPLVIELASGFERVR